MRRSRKGSSLCREAFCVSRPDNFKNMQDVTKAKPEKKISWQEYTVSLLIGSMPGVTLIVLLQQIGIVGALPSVIILLLSMWAVLKIREQNKLAATGKTVVFWLVMVILFFMIVPMALISIL